MGRDRAEEVIVTAPTKDTPMYVVGVNEHRYAADGQGTEPLVLSHPRKQRQQRQQQQLSYEYLVNNNDNNACMRSTLYERL